MPDADTPQTRSLALVAELGALSQAARAEAEARAQRLALASAILEARAAGQRQAGILAASEPTLTALIEELAALLLALVASTGESANSLAGASVSAQELADLSAQIQLGVTSESQAKLDILREGGAILAQTLALITGAMVGNRELAARLGGRVEQLRKLSTRAEQARALNEAAETALADSLAQLVAGEDPAVTAARDEAIAAALTTLERSLAE